MHFIRYWKCKFPSISLTPLKFVLSQTKYSTSQIIVVGAGVGRPAAAAGLARNRYDVANTTMALEDGITIPEDLVIAADGVQVSK